MFKPLYKIMIEIGLTYTSTTEVTNSNTALAIGSGDLPVFATPAMTALMENAAMMSVAAHLDQADTTVGIAINSTHSKASAIGSAIKATAKLIAVDNKKLTFQVVATANDAIIGEATHIRYIVNREKFLQRI